MRSSPSVSSRTCGAHRTFGRTPHIGESAYGNGGAAGALWRSTSDSGASRLNLGELRAFLYSMSASFPTAFAGLLRPEAYPHPVDRVELLETHISWVLLAGAFAYKIKRPVHYPFIDLRSPERRKFLCEEELRLNRRFAPDIYLELCGIAQTDGRARISALHTAANGAPAAGRVAPDRDAPQELAVRMRRFPPADELDRLLDARRIEPHELESFGRSLALIHARLPTAPASARWGEPVEVQALLIRNLLECAQAASIFGTSHEVLALRGPLEKVLPRAAPWMAARRRSGRVRECHGDLHSGNIVRLAGRLVAFDCLEYEPAFRWIDVADEVAFLSSDLKSRDRPLHAHAFRSGYLAESGDYHACRVLPLYEFHRALVRAKVAALEASGTADRAARGTLEERYGRLVDCASGALARQAPHLILMSGLSGSGKTWLARQLAERLSAVHIRSDIERKRRAGLRELEHSRSGVAQGVYSSEASTVVYADLARAAEDVLCGGYPVIIDATFLRRVQRAAFAELAARVGVPLQLIHCSAPDLVLRTRVAERQRTHGDASEADTAVLDWQLTHAEAPSPEEGLDVLRIDTTRPDALVSTLGKLAATAPRSRAAARHP